MSKESEKQEAKVYKRDKEEYDKKVAAKWENFFKAIAKDVETIDLIKQTLKEVEKRRKNGEPPLPVKSDEDLYKDIAELRKSIDAKDKTRQRQIIMIGNPPPIPDNPPKTTDFISKVIEKGGIPVGAGITVKPDLENPEGGIVEKEW